MSYARNSVEVTETRIKATLTPAKQIFESYEKHGYSMKDAKI